MMNLGQVLSLDMTIRESRLEEIVSIIITTSLQSKWSLSFSLPDPGLTSHH